MRGLHRVCGTASAISLVFACASTDTENTLPSGANPQSRADAGSSPAPSRVPVSIFEPDLPSEGQFCALLAAVECDGSEDCPAGKTCCGALSGGSLSYESIRCEDSCDLADGGRVICHENDPCPNPEDVCIRSIILPSYLGICGTPSAVTPQGFTAASTAAGEINCAEGGVCAQGQVCCSLTSWNAETQVPQFIDGRCADSAEACSCSSGTAPVPAAAANDGGITAGDGADGGL